MGTLDINGPITEEGRVLIKAQCPFSDAKQTFCARIEYFGF
jgi:hypothetical protein